MLITVYRCLCRILIDYITVFALCDVRIDVVSSLGTHLTLTIMFVLVWAVRSVAVIVRASRNSANANQL